MKKWRNVKISHIVLFVFLFISLLGAFTLTGKFKLSPSLDMQNQEELVEENGEGHPAFKDNEIIVELEEDTDPELMRNLLIESGIEVIDYLRLAPQNSYFNFYTFKVSPGDAKDASYLLSLFEGVVSANPVSIYYIMQSPTPSGTLPSTLKDVNVNDPYYDRQWYHEKISSEQAWDQTIGDKSVTIAIIDTGVDWQHEDLEENIWRNEGEIEGNGIDDDGNGFIDDVRGWDFVDEQYRSNQCYPGEDCVQKDNDPDDFHGHGTHVAGIAAARGFNGKGVIGSCPRCAILPLRAGASYDSHAMIGAYGRLFESAIFESIIYAADNGADIISMSFGGRESYALRHALEYAYEKNIILVAAAGKDCTPNTGYEYCLAYPLYPAAYPFVIAVSATDEQDKKIEISNDGGWIDVAAPGMNIFSTTVSGVTWGCSDQTSGLGYGLCSGTSTSAPLVSGLIGLALSKSPDLVSPSLGHFYNQNRVRTLVRNSVDLIQEENFIGTGRINALKLVSKSGATPINIIQPQLSSLPSTEVEIRGDVFSVENTNNPLKIEVFFGQGAYPLPEDWVKIYELSNVNYYVGGSYPITTWIPYTYNIQSGVYSILLRTTDSKGRIWEDKKPFMIDSALVWKKPLLSFNGNILYKFSQPLLVDVNNDQFGEVVILGRDGNSENYELHVIDYNGDSLPNFPIRFTSSWTLTNTPASADIDNDGDIEFVFTSVNNDNKLLVHAYNSLGNVKPGWPVVLGEMTSKSSPVIANIDGGNDLEIIIVTMNKNSIQCDSSNRVYVFKFDGTILNGWPQQTTCPVHGTPAVGDVNGDGKKDIVVSTFRWNPGTLGRAFIFESDGNLLRGWPNSIGGYYYSPILADLNRDGKLDIILGDNGDRLNARDYRDNNLAGWPIRNIDMKSEFPVVGNLDSDVALELSFIYSYEIYRDQYDSLDIINHDGSRLTNEPPFVLGPASPYNYGLPLLVSDILRSPAKEIYGSYGRSLYGAINTLQPITTEGFPRVVGSEFLGKQVKFVIGDINNNDKRDIIAYEGNGPIYLFDFSSRFVVQNDDWPMWRHDAQNTGAYLL